MKKLWFILILTTLLIYIARPSLAGDFPAKEVYEQASKKVVLIIARAQSGLKSLGTGSIMSDDGLVLTNAHVVDDQDFGRPCSDIRIFFKPERVTGRFEKDLKHETSAKVIKFSSELDLALLRPEDAPVNMGKIDVADPEEIKIGEEVIAIGHPDQGGLWSLTYGRISGSIENYNNIPGKDVFQTDTSLNRGNSGGPLLDQRGYLVAVNSNIARLSEDNLPIIGVNFAIKSSVVKSWLNKEGYALVYGAKPLDAQSKLLPVQAQPTEEIPAREEKVTSDPNPEPERKVEDKKPLANKFQEKKFQTPVQPYDRNDLFRAVEAELEEMMEEMSQKIRQKR